MPPIPKNKTRAIARSIVDDIMKNGNKEIATRLLLIKDNHVGYKDLGGWSRAALIDRIELNLLKII